MLFKVHLRGVLVSPHCLLTTHPQAYFILDELLLAGELQETSKKAVTRVIEAQVGEAGSWPQSACPEAQGSGLLGSPLRNAPACLSRLAKMPHVCLPSAWTVPHYWPALSSGLPFSRSKSGVEQVVADAADTSMCCSYLCLCALLVCCRIS